MGCYDAELDPELYGVYACEDDVDCALGSLCVSGRCEADPSTAPGPSIRILEPPQLDSFPIGEPMNIPITIGGRDLAYTTDQSEAEGSELGYIEVLLDGAIFETISAGELGEGIELDSLFTPAHGGLHHITIVARRLNGDPFDNAASRHSVGFWVDDGLEHVGILEP